MTNKQDTSVESSSLEEFLMLYHDAVGGLVVFEEDYGEFVQGISSLMDKAEQRGYLAGGKDLVNYLISHATAENEDTYFIKIKKSDLQSKLEGNGKEEGKK